MRYLGLPPERAASREEREGCRGIFTERFPVSTGNRAVLLQSIDAFCASFVEFRVPAEIWHVRQLGVSNSHLVVVRFCSIYPGYKKQSRGQLCPVTVPWVVGMVPVF